MAFTTTNLNGGPLGNRYKLEGDWSGSAGDATGTVTVPGGRVWEASFTSQNTSGPSQGEASFSVSGPTSGLLTISVYNHEDVTNGRFFIVYG